MRHNIKESSSFLICALLIFLAGCTPFAFSTAERKGTIAAYEKFVDEYPYHKLTIEAKKKIAENIESDSFYVYLSRLEDYLRNYPNGIFAEEAKQKREELIFEQAKDIRQKKYINKYIKEYPNGKFINECYKLMDDLELKTWNLTEANDIKNYIENLDEYLLNYPSGKFASKAKQKKEILFFEKAKLSNDIFDFDIYLKEYPDGKFASEAKQKREILFFEKAKLKNNISSYNVSGFEEYLKEYPNGKFSSEAKEGLMYVEAKDKNNIISYKNYLIKYPNGKFVTDVKHRLELLMYNNGKKNNTISDWTEYLKLYPDGTFASEAKDAIELLTYNRSKDEYLKRYPNGKFASKANNLIYKERKIKSIKISNISYEHKFYTYTTERYLETEYYGNTSKSKWKGGEKKSELQGVVIKGNLKNTSNTNIKAKFRVMVCTDEYFVDNGGTCDIEYPLDCHSEYFTTTLHPYKIFNFETYINTKVEGRYTGTCFNLFGVQPPTKGIYIDKESIEITVDDIL